MSMILYLRRASQSDIDALNAPVQNPPAAAKSATKASFFSRLLGNSVPSEPAPVETANPIQDFFFAPVAKANGDLIDFDKAWQALHFTLTGAEYYTDSPLGALLYEGEKIGDDIGYGSAWIVPADVIARFRTALSELSDEDIRARFDPAALVANDIYAFDDCQDYPEESLQYTMQGVSALRAFVERCTASGSSALAAIS